MLEMIFAFNLKPFELDFNIVELRHRLTRLASLITSPFKNDLIKFESFSGRVDTKQCAT